MLLNDFVKLKENKIGETSVGDFKKILKVFLPIAKKVLELEKLPKIILKKHIKHLDQPTMGRFHNEAYVLELAILDRHPVDVLRTLAHELVHAKQQSEHVDIDPTTGSDEENEANVLAGIIMREFNKLHPEYLETTPISEGGNLAIGGKEAEQINLKVTNRSYIVPILNNLLNAINNAFAKQYKTPLWKPELLKSQKFLSGSSLHFFNVKGIPDEQFVAKKPKVGDIDTMVAKDAEANLAEFLTSVQGKQLGPATLIGYQRGNEQFSSLWELQDPPIKVQIDLEFVAFEKDEPTAWSRFSHSSSWEDIQEGVKGVFHKFLIQSLAALSRKEFLLRKMVGRGKARAEQDVPTEDHMLSFAVSSKEGGGLRAKYEPVLDDKGLPLIKDGLQVLRALPAEGYEQDVDKIFLSLFGDRLGPKQAKQYSQNFWSFTGLLNVMNQLLNPEEKQRIADSFIKKLFDKGAQGLYKGDPERDAAEKTTALNVLLKSLKVTPPTDLDQIISTYKSNYRVTSESITEAIGEQGSFNEAGEEKPAVKAQLRKGMPHLKDLKPADFLDLLDEIHDGNGNFKLQNIPLNVKVDGFGGRFGKNASGEPFMATSRTEPRYKAGFADYHKQKGTTDPEILGRAQLFDKLFEEMMAAVKVVDSELGPEFLVNKQVTCEVLFLPFATRTESGRLKFVGIEYDELPSGVELALVPFRVVEGDTGEDIPNSQQFIKKLTGLGKHGNIMFIDNSLTQNEALDVTAIVPPMENIEQLKAMLASRKRDQAAQVKAALEPVKVALEKAIINDPNILGKDILGKDYEGIVINSRLGPIKVTSQEQRDVIAAKQAAKTAARTEQPREGTNKTAVVAIGSFVGHIGHEQLWDYTTKKAQQVNGDPYLFIGNAEGKNDPIPVETKVQTWHKMYPNYTKQISSVMKGGSIMQKIKHELINPLPGKPPRYDNIIIMVGEDQANMPIANALMKAVNKFPGYEHVKVSLEVTPRGTGMSFTKLRNILKDPKATPEQQYQVWAQGFDEKKLGKDWILHLMDLTRKGMNIAPTHVSPSGAVTNMRPNDDDYEINYGKNGMAKQPVKQKAVAERLFNSLMNLGVSEARHANPLDVPNPDDVHKPIKGDEPVKRGDIVWAQDPHNIATVHAGKVKRIGRTFVFLTLKNGEELAVPHDEVSKNYDVLSKRAHTILNKKGKHVGNYKVDEYQDRMAGVGMGNYVVDKNTAEDTDKDEYVQTLTNAFLQRAKLGRHNADEGTIMRMLSKFFEKFSVPEMYFNGVYNRVMNIAGTDQPTDEAMLPKSAFAGSDKNKLSPAAHLKGNMKRPARAGDLVGGAAESIATEAPIEMDPADPMDPMIYGYEKANPAKLKFRMARAAGQLKDLAARATNASPAEWQTMARQFDELKMNIEQIQHALSELAKQRRKGGVKSRGIDPTIDEAKQRLDPKCWKGYRKQGTKMKGDTRVNNCVKIGEAWENEISALLEQLAKK